MSRTGEDGDSAVVIGATGQNGCVLAGRLHEEGRMVYATARQPSALTTVVPEVSLVSNIGFGAGSTHTASADTNLANLPTGQMRFPLQHPSYMIQQFEADTFVNEQIIGTGAEGSNLCARLRRRLDPIIAAQTASK